MNKTTLHLSVILKVKINSKGKAAAANLCINPALRLPQQIMGVLENIIKSQLFFQFSSSLDFEM